MFSLKGSMCYHVERGNELKIIQGCCALITPIYEYKIMIKYMALFHTTNLGNSKKIILFHSKLELVVWC